MLATKDEIRQQMKALRGSVTLTERLSAEKKALDKLEEVGFFEVFEDGMTNVNIYKSFGTEFGTERILNSLLEKNFSVSVPVVSENDLIAAQVFSDTVYQKNVFGIDEPKDIISVDENLLNVIFVPALAFDKNGYRVGYGKGYYDRFCRNKKVLRIGICFDFQIISQVPREEHDVAVDYILTESEIIGVKR